MGYQRIVTRIALQLDRGDRIFAPNQNVISITTNQVIIDTSPTDQNIVTNPTIGLEAATTAIFDRVVAPPA